MNTCSESPSSLAAVARLHNLGGGHSVCTNRHFYPGRHGCPDRSGERLATPTILRLLLLWQALYELLNHAILLHRIVDE